MKHALIITTLSRQVYMFQQVNIKCLKDLGYTVHVACNYNDYSSRLHEVEVIRHQIDFDRNPLSIKNISAQKQLKKLLSAYEFEIIHVNAPTAGFYGRIFSKNKTKKLIYTAHGFHFFRGSSFYSKIFLIIEKLLSKFTDDIITINKEDYEALIEHKFYMERRHLINGIGVNESKFAPISPVEKMDLRKNYGFSETDYLLIFVGELSRGKNQLTLLKIVKEIEDSNLKLILAGDGEIKNELQNFIDSNRLNERIFLLGYRDDIPNLLHISDLAVSASVREGLPVNIIEAMMVGLPIIVNGCRGNKDLVNKNGFVINDNNIVQWIESINLIKNNENLSNYFSKNSIRESKKYTSSTVYKQLLKVYSHTSNIIEE
ncbi:TPA: glycosyltransferase [Streptococcus suis]